MPRPDASCGDASVTGTSSNRTSPESYCCAPESPLISVDLPAPLSPTSALTMPAWILRFTPLSTSTGPKLLRTSRNSMRTVMSPFSLSPLRGASRPARAHQVHHLPAVMAMAHPNVMCHGHHQQSLL